MSEENLKKSNSFTSRISARKFAKGEFRCFTCKKIFASKNGGWFRWREMEVHLCIACERSSRETPERK